MPGSIKGKVTQIDSNGGLVTDIVADQLIDVPRNESVRVTVDEHETFGIFGPEHGQPDMTLIAILPEPQGALRIELVSDSASAMLGVRAGAPVEVIW